MVYELLTAVTNEVKFLRDCAIIIRGGGGAVKREGGHNVNSQP